MVRAPLSQSELLARNLEWTIREVERLEVEEKDCKRLKAENTRLRCRLRAAKISREQHEQKMEEQIRQKHALMFKYEAELEYLQRALSTQRRSDNIKRRSFNTTPKLGAVPQEINRIFGSESRKGHVEDHFRAQPSIEEVGSFHWALAELDVAAMCYQESFSSTSMQPAARNGSQTGQVADTPDLRALKLDWLPKDIASKARLLAMRSSDMERARSSQKEQFDQKLQRAHQRFLSAAHEWESMQKTLSIEQMVTEVLVARLSESMDELRQQLPNRQNRKFTGIAFDKKGQSERFQRQKEQFKELQAVSNLPISMEKEARALLNEAEVVRDTAADMDDTCQWNPIMRRLRQEISIMRERGQELRVALAAKEVAVDRPRSSSSRLQKLQLQLESALKAVWRSVRNAISALGPVAISAAHLQASWETGVTETAPLEARSLKHDIDQLHQALLELRGAEAKPTLGEPEDAFGEEETRLPSQLLDFGTIWTEVALQKKVPEWLEVIEIERLAVTSCNMHKVLGESKTSSCETTSVRDKLDVQTFGRPRDRRTARLVVNHVLRRAAVVTHHVTCQPHFSDDARNDLNPQDAGIDDVHRSVDRSTRVGMAPLAGAPQRMNQATQVVTAVVNQYVQADISQAIVSPPRNQSVQADMVVETLSPPLEGVSRDEYLASAKDDGGIPSLIKFVVDLSAFAAIDLESSAESQRLQE